MWTQFSISPGRTFAISLLFKTKIHWTWLHVLTERPMLFALRSA